MQKRILRKGLVLGILILFVGASIIPSITGTIVEKQIPKENKSSLMGFNPRGTTWYVDDDNTMGPWDGTQEHPFQYIQDGINAANNGDTVFVYNGTYYDNLEIINKSISVIGENKETTIIDANWSSYGLIICADSCTIEGFTFRN